MTDVTKQTVTETETVPTEEVAANPRKEHRITVAERIIYLLGTILLVFLGLRFLLELFGANASSGFANFIYDVSHPFVAPFFGLFNYKENLGVGRFDIETLVAMVVYGLVIAVLAKLVALPSRQER